MQDECDCLSDLDYPNDAEAGMPNDSLTEHIVELERRLDRIYLITEEMQKRRAKSLSLDGRPGIALVSQIRREASFRVRDQRQAS